jgi:hypothetical protein
LPAEGKLLGDFETRLRTNVFLELMQNWDRYFVVWYASKCQDSETSNPDDETQFRAGLETVHHLI